MANINLLPWREERREELKKEYLTILAASVLFAGVVIFAWHSYAAAQVENQRSRNAHLEANIRELSAQVKEISAMKAKREELKERMRVIQDLQGNRPEIVHIFDELVQTLPDGVYFSELNREAVNLKVMGTAESNNRVSSLMRRLDKSEWFIEPNLVAVKANPGFGEQANDFELVVKISKPQADDESVARAK